MTELPYLGTEGFVRRPASEDRARENAASGVSSERQERVLAHLEPLMYGETWVEVGEALRLHHGQVSGTLSVLHQAGKVFQLRDKRGRSHPYVHAKWRHLFVASERFDEPSKTNAKVLRERNEEAEALLESALAASTDALLVSRRYVEAALLSLRGDRDA